MDVKEDLKDMKAQDAFFATGGNRNYGLALHLIYLHQLLPVLPQIFSPEDRVLVILHYFFLCPFLPLFLSLSIPVSLSPSPSLSLCLSEICLELEMGMSRAIYQSYLSWPSVSTSDCGSNPL